MTPEAFRMYDQAIKRFEADVRHALAVQAVEGREVTGTVDALTPDLTAYLVTAFKADDLKLEQEVRWTARPLEKKLEARQRLEENCRADLTDALQLRALGDLETILSQWSGPAFDHAKLHGFLVDREGGRQELRPTVGVIGRKIVGELSTLDHTGRGLPLGWIVVAAIVYFGWTALQWLIATDIRRQDERRVHRSNGPESPGSEPRQPVGVWEAVKRCLSSGYGAD